MSSGACYTHLLRSDGESRLEVTGRIPCGASDNSTEVFNCCVAGDICLEGNICHYTHTLSGGTGYYMSGCTDPQFKDPRCTPHCFSEFFPDVTFNYTSGRWACCTSGTDQQLHCDEPSDDTWQAPPPEQLKVVGTIPTSATEPGYRPSVTPAAQSGTSSSSSSTSTSSATKAAATTASSGAGSGQSSSGLSSSATAGIIAAIVIAVLASLAALAFLLLRRRRQRQRQREASQAESTDKTNSPPEMKGSFPPPAYGTPGAAAEVPNNSYTSHEMHDQSILEMSGQGLVEMAPNQPPAELATQSPTRTQRPFR